MSDPRKSLMFSRTPVVKAPATATATATAAPASVLRPSNNISEPSSMKASQQQQEPPSEPPSSEVVTDGTFTFKRKRKQAAAPEPAATNTTAKMHKKSAPSTTTTTKKPSTATATATYNIANLPPYPQSQHLYPHAQPLHTALNVCRPDSQRLTQLIKRIADEEVARCRNTFHNHPFVTKEVEHILKDFAVAAEQLVLDGTVAVAQNTPEEAVGEILQARLATLNEQKRRFVKEEKEWHELAVRRDEGPSATIPTPTPSVADASAANAQAASESAVGKLAEAQTSAQTSLEIQVDRICAMVQGCESLVASAEERAGQLASRFHRESFRMLPHVDSPAVLIKSLAATSRALAAVAAEATAS